MIRTECVIFDEYQDFVAKSMVSRDPLVLRDGMIEEIRELLADDTTIDQSSLTRILAGTEAPSENLKSKLTSEVGDILWYLTAGCELGGLSLRSATIKSASEITNQRNLASTNIVSINQIDELLGERICEGKSPPGRALIDDMVFFGFPILESREQKIEYLIDPKYQNLSPDDYDESAKLHLRAFGVLPGTRVYGRWEGYDFAPYGRYVLTSATRKVIEWLEPGLENHREYLEKAIGMAVCAFSAVGQTRLGITLSDAAESNMAKISRRLNNNTLLSGKDPERNDDSTNRLRTKNQAGYSAVTLSCNLSGIS